jgi:hypothetical protein
MNSKLVDAIGLKTHAVALTWADAAPQGAIQFKPGRWGCVVSVFATVAAKGRVGAFDRKTYGCWGGGVGLGFCNCYEIIPKKDSASGKRSQDGATDILLTISCMVSDT